uniref:BCL6 corepressor-like 1 n=1 Tax=Oryzias latipes TaxID=8090 RepID=A0A3P9HU21_ORYLA
MQVDSTLMNVGDGGTVSREISAPHKASTSMVGNPPQTLPAEFRRDVNLSQQKKTTPTKDCKTVKVCVDTRNCTLSPELSPPQQANNAPMSSSVLTGAEKRTDKRTEAPKGRADGPGVFPNSQWASSVKANREDSLNPYLSNVTSSKKSQQQTQSLQSAPAGFQCSAMFKPAQPVAFLPSTNFSSPLCKITLPPALGQIAALREATTSQFQKEVQPQNSSVGGAALMRTYPFSLSVGRTAEQKTVGSSLKVKSNHSTSKNAKCHGEAKSLASAVASPAVALPLQHPSLTSTVATHFTLSPTAANCCSSALANITSQSRLLNQVEKGNGIETTPVGSLNTASPCVAEDHTTCSTEPRDVPLDLSAKSKRPKFITDLPVSVTEPRNNESNQRDFLNVNRTHSTAYNSAGQYPILPNTHRNGSHQKQLNRTQNHQVPEPKSTWDKGSSQDSIKSIPGTYVGVASPILASALRGKDGKGTFADEFQSFAKQEFISIIDQGEHMASGGKKPSCLKGNQHAHSVKHVKNTSTAMAKNCPPKGSLTTALLNSANTHPKATPGKTAGSYSTTVANPAWQQQPHLLHQPSSVQRKAPHASPKTKGSAAADGCAPSKSEDEMWDRIKSPLSNLASIVKQRGVEPSTLIGDETNSQALLAERKADLLSPVTEVQPKQKSVCEYSSYKSVEKPPMQEELHQAMKRHEKSTKPVETNAAAYASQGECTTQTTKQGFLKSAEKSCLLGSSPSTNGNRTESKLAQVLEGETMKKESSSSDSPSSGKPEGVVASILTGQYAGWGDKFEKKANKTKEESPTKAKAAAVKLKKSSPKKLAKEKSAPDKLKTITAKKKEDLENTPVRASVTKKKKRVSELEQGLKGEKASQQEKEASPNNKIIPSKAEEVTFSKADSSSSPQSVEASESPTKEADVTEPSFPRLRRGRRRADDARLDLWGFATPSPPPPPPILPHADSPSSLPKTPLQPARRPRGRPRSNPIKEPMFQGKGKTASAEGRAPPQKKRQRCTSKKYETGEYITERDKLEDGEQLEDSLREDSGVQDSDPQADPCPSPLASSPEPPAPLRKASFTRSGSFRYQESEDSPECRDKPSGKRKFKSKHLSVSDEQKNKTKRISLGKRGPSLPLDDDDGVKSPCTPPPTPNSFPSPPPKKKSSSGRSSGSDSPPKKPVPPEVRRLIVNKNAGETLLQRAARLGYQDVVLYCLEKDIGEVNRRDNAGYTALHEASSRGWTQIVQILLKHGADVNCSAQDGTRPLHDAVASDNLPIVWLLLNHGADPTLATYSGHTPVKLAHSSSMKTFLTEYFTDLEGRSEQTSSLPWEFYSSSLFETDQDPCWDFLLSEQNQDLEENGTEKTEPDSDKDCLLFEFSSEPLLPCYHVQVSLTQGFCNWFLLADVLKRLKMSARIFRARYPYFEVVSLPQAELWKQVSISQVSSALVPPQKSKHKEEDEEDDEEGLVELVRCVQELQRLLGSSIHVLQDEDDEEEEEANGEKLCSR